MVMVLAITVFVSSKIKFFVCKNKYIKIEYTLSMCVNDILVRDKFFEHIKNDNKIFKNRNDE